MEAALSCRLIPAGLPALGSAENSGDRYHRADQADRVVSKSPMSAPRIR